MDLLNRTFGLRCVVLYLIVAFSCITLITPMAQARPLTEFPQYEPDDRRLNQAENYDRPEDLQVVKSALERKKVAQKLRSLGFSVKGVRERLQRLDDEEIHRMAERIQYVKAGGHLGLNDVSLAVLIVLIILAPLLAVVWLVLALFGHEIHLHPNGGHTHR